MRILAGLICFLLSVAPAIAQTYPEYLSTTVNDFADLLADSVERDMSAQLSALRRETGVEMTVVTLDTQSVYAPSMTLEQFATGLFNDWGIGAADRSDGVLVLVLREDRAMRIELGAAYGRDWNHAAERVVNHVFLPDFKEGRYARGITAGTTAVIDDIVSPFLAGEEAPNASDPSWIIMGAFLALVALFNGYGWIGDQLVRLRTCPKCGARALRQSRNVVVQASRSSTGRGVRRRYCTACDHSEETSFTISRHSDDGSSSGFGGGRSGGGGASGRW